MYGYGNVYSSGGYPPGLVPPMYVAHDGTMDHGDSNLQLGNVVSAARTLPFQVRSCAKTCWFGGEWRGWKVACDFNCKRLASLMRCVYEHIQWRVS